MSTDKSGDSQSTDIIGKSSKEQIWVLPPNPLKVYMLQQRSRKLIKVVLEPL